MSVLQSAKELLNIGDSVFCRRTAITTCKVSLYAVRLRVLEGKRNEISAGSARREGTEP